MWTWLPESKVSSHGSHRSHASHGSHGSLNLSGNKKQERYRCHVPYSAVRRLKPKCTRSMSSHASLTALLTPLQSYTHVEDGLCAPLVPKVRFPRCIMHGQPDGLPGPSNCSTSGCLLALVGCPCWRYAEAPNQSVIAICHCCFVATFQR